MGAHNLFVFTVFTIIKAHRFRMYKSLMLINTNSVICKIIVGERWERCLWQMKRPERVAAVCVQRRRTVAKAHTGHRNRAMTSRGSMWALTPTRCL